MSALSVLMMVAVGGAILALVAGITAMAHDGAVARNDSMHWMIWRVVFQAAALALIVLIIGFGWR